MATCLEVFSEIGIQDVSMNYIARSTIWPVLKIIADKNTNIGEDTRAALLQFIGTDTNIVAADFTKLAGIIEQDCTAKDMLNKACEPKAIFIKSKLNVAKIMSILNGPCQLSSSKKRAKLLDSDHERENPLDDISCSFDAQYILNNLNPQLQALTSSIASISKLCEQNNKNFMINSKRLDKVEDEAKAEKDKLDTHILKNRVERSEIEEKFCRLEERLSAMEENSREMSNCTVLSDVEEYIKMISRQEETRAKVDKNRNRLELIVAKK